ncbi:MAG: ribonuclease PH [Actinobacteria bacterium RBG_16_67_15]|nr:MAG: ribonuclease PH [Actinobacteria bacterium RBG_16_67_15]
MTRGFTEMTPGSVLMEMGRTRVLCTASFDNDVPHWMRNQAKGWLTAEYSMLPGSSPERVSRSSLSGGRTKEIQRLIGRSLRAVVDLGMMGEATLRIDCDVLQADGGTRTAAITGAWVAVKDAVVVGLEKGIIAADPVTDHCAAVSVGMVDGTPTLDLAYEQDVAAGTDMNVVMTGSGGIIEVQGTAERAPFTRAQLDELLDLATSGITSLVAAQREALAG